jgi:hypothetical protein
MLGVCSLLSSTRMVCLYCLTSYRKHNILYYVKAAILALQATCM